MYDHKINQSAANLWVEGMEALLWEIEGIASCTHHTPEELRLTFHTAKSSQSTVHDIFMKNMVELLSTCGSTNEYVLSMYWYVHGTY